jgi:hypothetical protein
MKYKFKQFNIEIIDPTVTVDLNTIQDKAIDKLLSVSITLETDTAKFGVFAQDMPYVATWEDSEVQGMVNEWLTQYEVS